VGTIIRQVRPSIRLLCAGVGGFLLSGAVVYFHAYGLAGAAPLVLVGGILMAVGTIGGLEEDAEPAESPRFHELADPSRPLAAGNRLTATRRHTDAGVLPPGAAPSRDWR
jgi:hypothetical protein